MSGERYKPFLTSESPPLVVSSLDTWCQAIRKLPRKKSGDPHKGDYDKYEGPQRPLLEETIQAEFGTVGKRDRMHSSPPPPPNNCSLNDYSASMSEKMAALPAKRDTSINSL